MKSSKYGYLVGAAIVAAIVFFFLWIRNGDVQMAILIAVAAGLVTATWSYVSDLIGKKKHQNIITTKLFQRFIRDGYREEKFGDYCGLIGKENGYSVRIYYDWNKYSKGIGSFGDIVVMIYIYPLVKDLIEFEIREDDVRKLRNKYDSPSRYGFQKRFQPDALLLTMNYYPWLSYDTVRTNLDIGLGILDKENIQPLDLDKLPEELVKVKADGAMLPDVETIWEYLEDQNKHY